MSGLECSEVMLSELAGRLDAEYYSDKAISIEQIIVQKAHHFLKDKEVVSGPFGSSLKSSAYMEAGDIAFVRIENIRRGFYINRDNLVFISYEDNARLSNSQLYTDDLILSKVGSIGLFARVDDKLGTCNISENNIGIKLSVYSVCEKHFMLVYLNSKYGQILLQRRKSGNVQPKLNVKDVSLIPIPKFSNDLYEHVSAVVTESDKALHTSTIYYTTAQNILNEAIHLTASSLSTQNITAKSSRDVFSTGRLDAEYFMPKYDNLFSLLQTLPTKQLGEIVSITKSIEPGSEYYGDEGIPFIRVSDISPTGITEPAIKIPHDTVPDIETLYLKKNTILLSKDGSIGIAYKVEHDTEAVTSGALLHLIVNASDVLPDYLTLVLNSEAVRMQAERDCNGAIIQHWRPEDISRVVIPVVYHETQSIIANHVQQSFSLRRKSERLINLAVKSVELAIESNETSAINYIKEELNQ